MQCRIAACLVLALVSLHLLAAAPAAAQVNGNTYTSPTYGYTLTWNANDWKVKKESSQNGYDELVLESTLSTVYFEAFNGYNGSATACVKDEQNSLSTTSGVTNVQIGKDANGQPLQGSDATGAYAVFTFHLTTEDGTQYDLAEYADCRTLVAGSAVLKISLITVRGAYNDAIAQGQQLLAGLALPGQAAQNPPTAEPTATAAAGTSGGAGGTSGETLTAQQVADYANKAAADVKVFWAQVFKDHGLFYVPLKVVILQSAQNQPCSEGAIHPGVGTFYCGLNQTVYFDLKLETRDAGNGGVGSVYYTIGHESGHDVQMQLGLLQTKISVEKELEADCLAGAFLKWEVDRGTLTDAQFQRTVALVKTFGDPEGVTADQQGAHGLGTQRQAMVLRGYYSGVDACSTFPGT